MRKLPVSVQSFKKMREEDYIYIDKTAYIYDLVHNEKGYCFFMSRPRRFGKSLLVSTLKEIFSGNKHLFDNLWISKSDYAWQEHPIIYLDFSFIAGNNPDDLRINLSWKLIEIGKLYGIDISAAPTPESKFEMLVNRLAQQTQVVILIDEYDKPLLDNVHSLKQMRENQKILKNFYAAIKAADEHIRFLFLTGVTKFSKTSVFSGMNNLIDLTLSNDAAALLGYTDEEIDHYFQSHIQDIAQAEHLSMQEIRDTMKYWYNGYQFSKSAIKVYNPFSTLMYLLNKDRRNYWFETGTPSFLVHLIKERKFGIEDLENAEINIDNLGSFDIDNMRLVPLLLQTGYLTFKDYNPVTRNFSLSYPNEETKASFLLNFMESVIGINTEMTKNKTLYLTQALQKGNLEEFFSLFKTFLAGVPYDIQIEKEQYYQSIFYVILSLLGAYIDAEVSTNNGRIDCTVTTNASIYIFEFKLTGTSVQALAQIEEKEYYQKFLFEGKTITLVGVSFDKVKRNIKSWVSRII